MHLKRQQLIAKGADRSFVEAQTEESRRQYYLSQRKAVLEALVAGEEVKEIRN